MEQVERKYYRITARHASGAYYESEENLSSVIDMLKDCEVDGGYYIRPVMMTEEAYKALPEFAGF